MTHLQKFWTGLLVFAGILFFILLKLGDILWPFLFAIILAYLLYPLVQRLQSHGIRKSVSVWLVFILFSLVFFSIGTFFISMIRIEIPVVQAKIPVYIDHFQKNTIPYLENRLHLRLQKATEVYIKDLTEKLLTLSPGVADSVSNFASQAFSKTINVFIFMIDLLLIPVVMIYFLFDFEKMNDWIPRVVPEIYQSPLKNHLQEINAILKRFIGGQLLISSFLAVVYMIGLTWIGLELSVILGLFSALLNIIPYIGVLIGALISVLFAFFKYHDLTHILLVVGLYVLGHLLDGYYLNPKIVGKQIGLHPLIVIFSLFAGGKMLGVIGLIFSVPVAAILNYLLKIGFDSYRKSEFYSRKSP